MNIFEFKQKICGHIYRASRSKYFHFGIDKKIPKSWRSGFENPAFQKPEQSISGIRNIYSRASFPVSEIFTLGLYSRNSGFLNSQDFIPGIRIFCDTDSPTKGHLCQKKNIIRFTFFAKLLDLIYGRLRTGKPIVERIKNSKFAKD